MEKYQKQIASYIFITLCMVLLLIPFHGFLTTWIGSNTGGLLLWRAWKEILLLPAGLLALYLIFRDQQLRTYLWDSKLHKIMLLASLWLLVITLLKSRDIDALILGTVIYLRLMTVYILGRIVLFYRPVKRSVIMKLILLPAAGVVFFGLLQMFVLPHDFLKHFGYQEGVTIPPFFMIDRQLDALRIFSTTRGPNSMGVYLILPIILVMSLLCLPRSWQDLKSLSWSNPLLPATVCLLFITVLYGSHSRSAWLGTLAAVLVFAYLKLPQRFKKTVLVVGAGGALLLSATSYFYRNTTFVQNVILHDNQQTGSPRSSNDERLEAWGKGINDITKQPLLGCGSGCAGPASFHHEDGARISENQYLQAGQEMGIIGVILLLAVLLLIARLLYLQNDSLSVVLLSSFVGVLVAGLFMHAWADDIVAYTWWIAFGLLLPSEVHYKHESQAD